MKPTVYTGDTSNDEVDNIVNTDEELDILSNITPAEIPQHIDPDTHIEFFECAKCGEYNIITTKMKKRRSTRTHHIKVNDVTWGSLKKYATINNVTFDYALSMLIMGMRTNNISYMISERQLVDGKTKKRKALR
jgi:predicted RNA-binding Zn-ribbon protein involved in translation (DUF1610 family)